MRILIADDMPKVRTALQLLLKQHVVLDVVGAISRSGDLVKAVKALYPDLLLLDWELAGEGTREVLSEVRRLDDALYIVALSSKLEAREAALAAGVDAFISKGDPPEQVLDTLLTMAAEHSQKADSDYFSTLRESHA